MWLECLGARAWLLLCANQGPQQIQSYIDDPLRGRTLTFLSWKWIFLFVMSTACNSCPCGWGSGAEKVNLCRFHLSHAGGQELNPGPNLNKRCISALLLVEHRAYPNSHLLSANRVLTSESSITFVPKVVALEWLVCSHVPRPCLFPRYCHVLALEQVFCIHVAQKETCNFAPRTLIRTQDCTAHILDGGIEWFRERERLQPLPIMSLGLCLGFTQIKAYHDDLRMGPCTLSYLAQASCASIKVFGTSECSQYSVLAESRSVCDWPWPGASHTRIPAAYACQQASLFV